jgi:tetratricopeptide (TPR) repeat protein
MGRYEEAVADLSRAIDLAPDYAWAIGSRGEAYQEMGLYEEALADLTRAIDLRPTNDWYRYACSLTHICRGEPDEGARYLTSAIDLAMAAIESSGSPGQDLYNLAIYKAALGDYEQADRNLQEAIERAPDKYLIRDAIDDLRDLSSTPGINAIEITRLAELLRNAL